MIRITIEAPQGAGKTRLAGVIAGILQLMGLLRIQILDDTDVIDDTQRPLYGSKPLPAVDAQIICKQP